MTWIIFIPVLLFGAALLILAAVNVARHVSSLSWLPVPATLLERGVELNKGATSGDSIKAASRYRGKFSYQWQGRSYESTRVSFSRAMTRSVGSSIDDWDQRLSDLLGEVGGTLTVWVNPRAPSQAVLLRDLRWVEIGCLIGLGAILLWIASVFLFGSDLQAAPAVFSWRTVGGMWVAGLYLGILVPLLWRDGHPVWSVVAAIPLLLAINGTLHGMRQP